MIDETQNQELQTPIETTENAVVDNQLVLDLSTGARVVFKPEKELTWGDFSKYEDLGAGLKGRFDASDKMLDMDLSNIAKGSRAQKEFLINFFWDAHNVKLADLKASEIVALLKPIKVLNPLDGLAEGLEG